MPCCGDREKIGDMRLEQTWDYINLNDFKSSSCFTGFSYGLVWVFLGISIAVYAVDTFTAVNLLVFNKWSSQVQPKIPFRISRWIFAGCIIASFVLLAYRWLRAIRVMRSGSIAESYLDPLAVRVQSIRVGKSKGYRRFLVFAELTKSKKGADYVALFVYFSFESWLRVVFADGPRQVINAITLYSVMELDLIPTGQNAATDGTSSVEQFFINVKALAEKNYQQALILFGMLFTLIIWVIAALSLMLAVILYLIFLWHHIPSMDNSLKAYCRRKINTRLERIVRKKTATALAKGGAQFKDRTPTMPLSEGEELKPIKHAPTLPSVAEYAEDKKPLVTVAPLSRRPTEGTLPPYTSEPSPLEPHEEESYRAPKLPDLDDDVAWLTKTNTQNSAHGDSTSLTGAAAPMGYSPLDNQYGQPTLPSVPSNPNQGRPYSPSMNRPPMGGPGRAGPTGPMPMEGPGRRTPGPGYSQTPPPGRQTPGFPRGGPAGRMPYDRPYSPATNQPYDRQQTPQANMRDMRSNTPANNLPGRPFTPGDRTASPRPPNQGGYRALNQNNMRPNTPAGNGPPGRSLTSPAPNDIVDRSNTPVDRSASARPPNQGGYVAFNQTNMNDMRSNSPANNTPSASNPPNQGGYVPFNQTIMNGMRADSTTNSVASTSTSQNPGGYTPFNPFSSSMDIETDARSQSPSVYTDHEPVSTTVPSHGSSSQSHHAAPTSEPVMRSATAGPSYNNSGFQAYQRGARAATTTPSNGYGRHEIPPSHSQPSHHTAEDEEDDDEYDPLSYYGSAH